MKSYENNLIRTYSVIEKKRKLEVAKQEVEHTIDKLGMGIDEGIKDAVAILRAMDFPTSSSCAGHTEKESYSPPYIEIYSKAPEGWKEDKAKQEVWKEINLKYRNKLSFLLDQFYKNRNVPFDSHLHLDNVGIYGGFRLQAVGTEMKKEELGVETQNDVLKKIKQYQNEMADFTTFLEETFFNNK